MKKPGSAGFEVKDWGDSLCTERGHPDPAQIALGL